MCLLLLWVGRRAALEVGIFIVSKGGWRTLMLCMTQRLDRFPRVLERTEHGRIDNGGWPKDWFYNFVPARVVSKLHVRIPA